MYTTIAALVLALAPISQKTEAPKPKPPIGFAEAAKIWPIPDPVAIPSRQPSRIISEGGGLRHHTTRDYASYEK